MHAPATTRAKRACWLTILALIASPGLALSACRNMDGSTPNTQEKVTVVASSEPTTTVAPTSTPIAILTETPSATPTATPTVGPSPTSIPTPAFGSSRVGNDFLFGNQPEGCELPCWQGLVVGESDTHDVQQAFETAFGFSGMSDLPMEKAFTDSQGKPDLLVLPQQWFFGDSGDTFFVGARVQKDSLMLQMIQFYGQGSQFEPYVNPQWILRNLGTPSHLLVSLGITEAANWANLELLISYSRGITVYYGLRVVPVVGLDSSNPSAELCLSNMTKYPLIDVFLTRPFEGDDTNTLLSPLSYKGIDLDKVRVENYRPLEEVFGISLEEVTKLAQERDNACIYAPAP